jgi:arabinofuranan 3-O-arabinosyltransferase
MSTVDAPSESVAAPDAAPTVRQRVRAFVVHRRAYLIVALASTFVVSTWFRTGTFIATGDMGPFIRQGWAPEALWSWNHSVTGAGSAAYTVARGAEFALIEAVRAVGLDEYAAQWLWYTFIYGLVGFGTAFAARAFVRSDTAVVVAGLFGILNGFFLTRLPNPLNIISVAVIALVTGVALRVAQGRRVHPAVAGLVLMPTSFLAFNPPMLVVAYAWALAGTVLLVALALGRAATLRLLKWFVLAVPWAVALNIWWLVPLAQGFTGGGGAVANADFTDPTNWIWAQINNTIPNVVTLVANWAWYRPQYLPFAESLDQPWWIWIRYLIPVLVVLAPVVALRRNRRAALALLGLSLVAVFLAKGLMPPLDQVNLWLYQNVPGFWLFREPMSKLGQLLVVFFAVLLAMLVEGLIDRARTRRTTGASVSLVAGLTAVVLVLAYPIPLYTGTVIPDERPLQPSAHVRVPDFWWQMAETVDADPAPGKVLVLPLDDYYQMPTTWGFFGVDSIANLLIRHPVVAPKPDGYFGDVPGFSADVRAIETALLSGDLAAVPRLLDAVGVSRVIVRHDLVRGLPGRTFADDAVLDAALERVPGMTRQVQGTLDLWYVGDGSSPTVRTYDGLVSAPADPSSGAAAIGSMGTDRAIEAAKAEPSATAGVVVDDEPRVSDDVVHWPVPAVESGPATTTVTVTGGTYRLAQRSRAAPSLVPSVDRSGPDLVLSDPTRVEVDGVVRSVRPDLRLPVQRADVVAVTAGTRTVSLDGWGRDVLAERSGTNLGPASVTVGAATSITAWAPSTTPARPTPVSEVYDCNNYEPRPARELGLTRTLRQEDGQQVVSLSALDHAACARVELADAEAGRTYRVRVEYRTLEGKRPQLCLWQVSTDGCELTARLALTEEWTPFEAVLTLDEVATGLQIIMQANVGQRLLGRTAVEFRGLTIEALDPVLEDVVFPEEVPETTVALTAGTHTLRVTGGAAGTVLAPFEPLQDCFRYDDRTPEQAGLRADVLPDEPQPAYRMGAVAHTACVGATAPTYGDSALYELSFEARSVDVRDPKVCLFGRGPDRCQRLAPVVWDEEWQEYSVLVAPDPTAVETRLYLYGLRDLDEQRQSQVEYRAVRLRPVASTSAVVLVRETTTEPSPEMDWRRADPTRYPVEVGAGRTVLALRETTAPGWSFQGGAGSTKTAVQGWANAWLIDSAEPIEGALVYSPARFSRWALLSLPVALVAMVAAMVLGAWWRRRRAAREATR